MCACVVVCACAHCMQAARGVMGRQWGHQGSEESGRRNSGGVGKSGVAFRYDGQSTTTDRMLDRHACCVEH